MKKLSAVIAILMLAALLMPACASNTPDCTKPDVWCVGLVTDVGKVDDKGFNQSAWKALQQAKTDGLVDWVQKIETVNSKDYSENIQVFADAGYDMIVTSSAQLGQATLEAAKKYPRVLFIGVDQPVEEFTPAGEMTQANYVGLVFPEDQAGFLAGALAAMMSGTHKIGAVLSTDANAAILQLGKGYQAGATYIDAQQGTTTVVNIVYHNDVPSAEAFTDPEWGAATAKTMVGQGVDVLFGAGGQTGESAITTGAEQGAYVIGADIDQYYALPVAGPRMLSSVVKLVNSGVYGLIKMAVENNFPGGANYLGSAGYAPFHDMASFIPEAVKSRLSELNQDLLSGKLQTGVSVTSP